MNASEIKKRLHTQIEHLDEKTLETVYGPSSETLIIWR